MRWFLPVLLVLLGVLPFTTPVAASVPQPTTLEIQGIDAYQNALEDGDQLYLITYYVMVNSTQSIDALFIFRLRDDTDLEIASTEAFPFHDLGYGLGLVAFYFEADDPAIPTWGSNLSVEVIGNPFIDWDGDIPGTTLDLIDWNTGTTAETQQMISNKILYLATEFGQSWEVELVTTVQGVTTLTSAGASYFMTVVPYLGEIVPYILGQYIFSPDFPIDEKPASDDYAAWLEESIEGTVFDLGPLERAHHWSANTIRTGVYYGFVIALFVLLIMKSKLNRGTMLLFWPFVVAGAFFGVPLQVTIIAAFFCLISTVWVFYKGTT
jgi:hypothetical protein